MGTRAGAISGKSRVFVLEQEVVTTHFPAVAYHVQEGCDNRLEIRRKSRRQGAREELPSPLGLAGVKNYEKTYLDTSCWRGRHCCRGWFHYPLLVDGRQQQRPGSAAAADGFRRAGQGGAQIHARRRRCDRNGDADLQRGAEVAA